MTYFTKDNIQELVFQHVQELKSNNIRGTWSINELNYQDLKDVKYFFKNSFRKGLMEYPEKIAFPKPYSTNKFNLQFFVKNYLKPNLLKKLIKVRLHQEFVLFQDQGFNFPEYKHDYRDLYHNFNGLAYNSNLRKYCSFIGFINLYLKGEQGSIRNYCEIGGGYGGLAEMLILNKSVKNYVIIDLFETLSVSMTYLSNALGDNWNYFFVNDEKELDQVNFKENNILFVPVKSYSEFFKDCIIKLLKIDFFINTNSFVEMEKKYVNDYFEFIEQFTKIYFFSSNSLSRIEIEERHCAKDFPYDDKWTHIAERKQFLYNDLNRLSVR